jgi:hypothetical protein
VFPDSDEWLPKINDWVPLTVDEAKRRKPVWLLTRSRAIVPGGFYLREIDLSTGRAAEPTYTASWHPTNGTMKPLGRLSHDKAYRACVDHYQEHYKAE